jgi:hypothetical protein
LQIPECLFFHFYVALIASIPQLYLRLSIPKICKINFKMRAQDLPDYKDMPTVKGMPHGTAWGLWDKNGERDNCGSLNLLTPENTKEAQKEIQSGTGVALK